MTIKKKKRKGMEQNNSIGVLYSGKSLTWPNYPLTGSICYHHLVFVIFFHARSKTSTKAISCTLPPRLQHVPRRTQTVSFPAIYDVRPVPRTSTIGQLARYHHEYSTFHDGRRRSHLQRSTTYDLYHERPQENAFARGNRRDSS